MGGSNDMSIPTPIALDGGWGWIIVLGSFLAYFIEDGWSYSFGVFYPKLLEHFEQGKGKTAIIGALMYGFPMIISPIVCALTTVFGCRRIGLMGGVTTAASFLISMFATSVDFLCFSTGIIASIGLAMSYLPALLIVTYYFEKRRGLATGLAVTGSGLGSFAFPPLLEYLLSVFGWRGTFLILGGICSNLLVAAALYRAPRMTTVSKTDAGDQKRGLGKVEHLRVMQGDIYVPRLHNKQISGDRLISQSSHDLSIIRTNYLRHPSTLSLSNVGPQLRSTQPIREQDQSEMDLQDVGTNRTLKQSADASISSPDLYLTGSESNDANDKPKSSLGHFVQELRLIPGSMFDRRVLKCWPFLVFCGSSFLLFLWAGVPYIYLVDKSILLGINSDNAAFLLSIIGISRTVGQLVMGFLGDLPRVNTIVLYALSICICGVSTICVPFFKNYALLGLYAALFGFSISVTYSLMMLCVVELVGLSRATNAFGILQMFMGVATLLGTPIAGWLFDATNQYDPSFYTAGGWILVSGLLLLSLPRLLRHQNQSNTAQYDHDAELSL